MSTSSDGVSESTLHVREAAQPQPRVKPRPRASAIPCQFHYAPSADGTDENLLVLLHGLGDTHLPFAKLGRSLSLPQTAVLALCAPQQVPFLDDPGYQWYASFDALGELLTRPNPTPALDLLERVLKHLLEACGWMPGRMHLFGFAQGGSVVGEFGLRWWRLVTERAAEQAQAIGSIVTICGPLLSYPTCADSARCRTLVLVFHRGASAAATTAYRKGYSSVREVSISGDGSDAMPKGRGEWEGIMEFWSQRLSRRLEGDDGDTAYEVVGGSSGT